MQITNTVLPDPVVLSPFKLKYTKRHYDIGDGLESVCGQAVLRQEWPTTVYTNCMN